MVVPVCLIPVSICCAKRRFFFKLASLMCWRGISLSTMSRVFVPIFFSGQSVVLVADVKGVGFWPRAVVVRR